MNKEDEKYLEIKSREIFQNDLQNEELIPPLYMKTRILANFRERYSSRTKSVFFFKWALGAFTMVFFALFMFENFFTDYVSISTGKPLLVNFDVKEINSKAVAYAEIKLPEGVSFYSKKFPEYARRRVVRLNWEYAVQDDRVSFVMRGSEVGKKVIDITFFGYDQNVISKKKIRVMFKENIS